MFTCILCRGTESICITDTLRDDSTGTYQVLKCLSCGHCQVSPIPSAETNTLFYDHDQQMAFLHTVDVDYGMLQQKAAHDTQRRIDWLKSCLPESHQPEHYQLLDIGCGYGFFVDLAHQQGYHQAMGIDASRSRVFFAQTHMQGSYLHGVLDRVCTERWQNRFDVLTLFHVLEHVESPIDFLQLCFKLLKPGGCLLIEVPNLDDEMLEYVAAYRHFYWQMAHLSYFNAQSLARVIQQACFQSVEVKGIQRYGLDNVLYWIQEGKPQIQSPGFYTQHTALIQVEKIYRAEREKKLTSDTLIAQVLKR